jgi:hypothetical protein
MWGWIDTIQSRIETDPITRAEEVTANEWFSIISYFPQLKQLHEQCKHVCNKKITYDLVSPSLQSESAQLKMPIVSGIKKALQVRIGSAFTNQMVFFKLQNDWSKLFIKRQLSQTVSMMLSTTMP